MLVKLMSNWIISPSRGEKFKNETTTYLTNFNTVDGWTPAPLRMKIIPHYLDRIFIHPKVVHDFNHPHYPTV